MNPNQYPKRILLAVSGLSPQILTETLYGLAVNNPFPFIPTEIYLITTRTGANSARLNLLNAKTGHFHALCKEYELPAIAFDDTHILVIKDRQGQALDDIRTPEQNEAAADFITGTLRRLTESEDSAVHVSIAGGRKSMGYYIGYALSLFGRSQDRMSHVLVSEGYEGHPEFYYPTREAHIIQTRAEKPQPLDTRGANVVLAEIPFIRLRQDMPDKLLNGQAGFLETITLADKAKQPPELIIDLKQRRLSASGERIALPDSQLAFYCWLLEQTVPDQTSLRKPLETEPNLAYGRQYLKIYRTVAGEFRDIGATERGLKNGMENSFFSEKITRINKNLEQLLGKRLARAYRINSTRNNGFMFYNTELSAEQLKYDTIPD